MKIKSWVGPNSKGNQNHLLGDTTEWTIRSVYSCWRDVQYDHTVGKSPGWAQDRSLGPKLEASSCASGKFLFYYRKDGKHQLGDEQSVWLEEKLAGSFHNSLLARRWGNKDVHVWEIMRRECCTVWYSWLDYTRDTGPYPEGSMENH